MKGIKSTIQAAVTLYEKNEIPDSFPLSKATAKTYRPKWISEKNKKSENFWKASEDELSKLDKLFAQSRITFVFDYNTDPVLVIREDTDMQDLGTTIRNITSIRIKVLDDSYKKASKDYLLAVAALKTGYVSKEAYEWAMDYINNISESCNL